MKKITGMVFCKVRVSIEANNTYIATHKPENNMTKQEMMEKGEAHAKAGGVNAPHELQSLDAQIFDEIRSMDKFAGAKFYKEMRGAFNKGWGRGYLAVQGMA